MNCTVNSTNLRQLFWIRIMIILLQIAAVLNLTFILDLPLQLISISWVIGLYIALTIFIYFRSSRALLIKDRELSLHLWNDLIALFVFCYFTGGMSNPMVLLFILPVIIAWKIIPLKPTYNLTGGVTWLYLLLTWWGGSKVYQQADVGNALAIYAQVNWMSFMVLVLAITLFVPKMSRAT